MELGIQRYTFRMRAWKFVSGWDEETLQKKMSVFGARIKVETFWKAPQRGSPFLCPKMARVKSDKRSYLWNILRLLSAGRGRQWNSDIAWRARGFSKVKWNQEGDLFRDTETSRKKMEREKGDLHSASPSTTKQTSHCLGSKSFRWQQLFKGFAGAGKFENWN